MKYPTYSLLILALLLLCACAPEDTRTATKSAEPFNTYFPISINEHTLHLQLALIQSEQSKGLMNRDSMPEDHGMLFLFQQPGPQGFWMRNTRIPLDIGYFDASGQLLEVHALYPYDENPVNSRSQSVQIAIETNRGWFARHQITPGAQIDLNALSQAISGRGKSPASFSLQNAQ